MSIILGASIHLFLMLCFSITGQAKGATQDDSGVTLQDRGVESPTKLGYRKVVHRGLDNGQKRWARGFASNIWKAPNTDKGDSGERARHHHPEVQGEDKGFVTPWAILLQARPGQAFQQPTLHNFGT
ncbi:hypothetical protein OG21DRAFT_1527000 [Imleria badia]|nr:hypothetical protein OG21DRAFT_1527000 [Imleria badia]